MTKTGDDVTCGTVHPQDVGDHGLISPGYFCTCGCTRCLSVCDGKGPTFGATIDGTTSGTLNENIVPLIRIDGQPMPDAGRLGIYVRMRSTTSATLTVLAGDPDDPGAALTYLRSGIALATVGSEFVEYVFYDDFLDADLDTVALEWSEASQRPTVLALSPPTQTAGTTLMEVDCVVPFWTGRE